MVKGLNWRWSAVRLVPGVATIPVVVVEGCTSSWSFSVDRRILDPLEFLAVIGLDSATFAQPGSELIVENIIVVADETSMGSTIIEGDVVVLIEGWDVLQNVKVLFNRSRSIILNHESLDGH